MTKYFLALSTQRFYVQLSAKICILFGVSQFIPFEMNFPTLWVWNQMKL